jgi:hypothetical protein
MFSSLRGGGFYSGQTSFPGRPLYLPGSFLRFDAIRWLTSRKYKALDASDSHDQDVASVAQRIVGFGWSGETDPQDFLERRDQPSSSIPGV